MSDYDRDRGAYSPTGESPLAFDARDPSGRGARRPPTTLIVSALILLVLVFALVFFYRSGFRHSGQPPVVGQPLSDIRQAPPASAQPTDEAAGLQIYGAGHEPPASAAPAFAPLPEQPLPRQTGSPQPAAANLPAQPGPAAAAAQAQPVAQPALRSATASPTPTPVQPAPVLAPVAAPGLAMVQIGAFSSPALAEKGWGDVARMLPGQMVGRTKKVETFAKGAETFYRAYVGGFGSKAEASGFCADLKAAGHDCIVK